MPFCASTSTFTKYVDLGWITNEHLNSLESLMEISLSTSMILGGQDLKEISWHLPILVQATINIIAFQSIVKWQCGHR